MLQCVLLDVRLHNISHYGYVKANKTHSLPSACQPTLQSRYFGYYQQRKHSDRMFVSAQQLVLWLIQKLPTTRKAFPSNSNVTVNVPFIRCLPTECKQQVAEVVPSETLNRFTLLLRQRYNSGRVLAFLNNFLPLMSILDQVWPFYHFQLFSDRFWRRLPIWTWVCLPVDLWLGAIYIFSLQRLILAFYLCVRTDLISEIWHSLLCSCVVLVHLIPYSF